jgi:hypothetical protein
VHGHRHGGRQPAPEHRHGLRDGQRRGDPVCNQDTAYYFGGLGCATDEIYAVDDPGTTGSQFFRLKPTTGAVNACGTPKDHSDFEGLESIDNVLYAISAEGSEGFVAGGLYQLDGQCRGSLLGRTGIIDVEGLALDPESRTFWGVAGNDSNLPEGSLVRFDPADVDASGNIKILQTIVVAQTKEVEAIT